MSPSPLKRNPGCCKTKGHVSGVLRALFSLSVFAVLRPFGWLLASANLRLFCCHEVAVIWRMFAVVFLPVGQGDSVPFWFRVSLVDPESPPATSLFVQVQGWLKEAGLRT